MKFGRLILRKTINIVAIRCHILQLKCTKFDFGLTALPDPLAGFKGLTSLTSKRREGRKDGGKGERGVEGVENSRRKGKGKGREGSRREGRGEKGQTTSERSLSSKFVTTSLFVFNVMRRVGCSRMSSEEFYELRRVNCYLDFERCLCSLFYDAWRCENIAKNTDKCPPTSPTCAYLGESKLPNLKKVTEVLNL